MAFNAGDIEARLTLDRDPFQRSMDAAIREGRRFSQMKFTATLDADKRPFTKAVNDARAAGVRFGQREFTAKLDADSAGFASAVRKATASAERLDGKDVDVEVDLDSSGFSREVRALEARSKAAGITVANNFRSPLRRIKWPAIFAAITAGAVAVPAAFMGVTGAALSMAGALAEPLAVMGAFGKAQQAIAEGSDDAGAKIAEFEIAFKSMQPVAKAFVSQLIGMRDELDKFQNVMQRAVLPGFTKLLSGIEDAAPAITQGSAAIGAAMGRVTARAGEMFASPVFQGELTRAFENSVPVIEAAGDALFNLFRDITQFVAATKSLGIGLGQMIDSASMAFTRFFTNLIPYSKTLGRSFAALGGIAEDMVAALGSFAGILSTGTAPALETLRTTLAGVYEVFLDLLSGALPGLTTTFLGLAQAVNGVMAVLGPLAPTIGALAGQIAPFVVALKLIDLVSFGRVAAQFNSLKGGIQATTGTMNKLKVGASGLMAFGLGPLGIAAGLLGTALMVLGHRQAAAAQAAAEHKDQVEALTQAIIEDKGAVGESTRAYQLQAAAEKRIVQHGVEFGVSRQLMTKALMGNKDAAYQVTGSLEKLRQRTIDQIHGYNGFTAATGDARSALVLKESVLNEVITNTWSYNRAMRQAKQAALQERAAFNGVTVEILKQMNALIRLHSQQMIMLDASLALRESQLSLKAAHRSTTQALRQHGRQSMEYKQAAIAEERQILQVLDATRKKTFETHKATGAEKAQTRAIHATDRAALRMAATYRGALPPVLKTYIGGMNMSRLSAIGARVETDRVGRSVVRLPNGKTIRIRANTQPYWSSISRILATPLYKTLTLTVDASALHGIAGQEAAMINRGPMQPRHRAKGSIDVHGYADGGMTFRGKPVKMMQSGIASMVPPNTPRLIGDNTAKVESFIPHDRSPRSMSLLRETNRLMGNPLQVAVPNRQPATEQHIYRFEPGSVVLDASKIKDIRDLISLMGNLRQTARAHGARSTSRGES